MEDEWTIDANEALTMSLVRPTSSGIEKIASFKPRHSYAVFGEEERIFGHKGLKIDLQFDARDLRPNLTVSSAKKFIKVGDVEAADVKLTMKGYLPGVAYQSRKEYDQAVKSLPDTWTPPGTLTKTLEKNGEIYEIWQGTLSQPEIRQLVKRIQITVLFYIEGGSYVGVDEEGNDEPEYSLARWTVFFVYKKTPSPKADGNPQYTFQGYATTYNFWMFQQPTPPSSPGNGKVDDSWELLKDDFPFADFAHRIRISQFLILPPFHGKGIGAFLYNTMFEIATNTAATKEVTVEDPNEDFDLLRDLCDMKYLRKNVPEFANLTVNTDVPVPAKGGILRNNTQITPSVRETSSIGGIIDIVKLEDLRIKTKIAPRQFWRLVEMHLMSKLPDSVRPQADDETNKPFPSKTDKHAYTLWRLLLKQRLYRRNVSILGEFEITERIIKLNETVDNVEWEYARILARLESTPPVTASEPVATNGKRRLTGGPSTENLPSKKARVEEAEEE
ncbi:Histone acetyltransferase type B catalytic subunit [Daldinia childiae]|uniref:Histone acetyltransferase type B catalytic subunit n=1 Tax=Daldinia childiae TaxID=326645 RepID=UPI001444A364|nr:Histone acetyltransferase type B catalytic subunit [Daldinia childiae]KAF3060011.1 Histone acetyltransferase type B catalytic subunit [Daldinia childiae]